MTSDREFRKAVLEGNSSRASQSLHGDVNVNVPFEGNSTALHHAAGHGYAALVRLLLERGATVNARDAGQATPLHWAASIGNVDAARLLLQGGADVDARTVQQNTPLHRAARHGRIDVVRLLLENGADREARNADQLTPFELARNSDHELAVKHPLLTLLSEGLPSVAPSPTDASAKRARSASKRSKPRQC